MKMRTVVGGAVVVAFVAGGYLGGWFPKFGTGSGFGIATGGGGSGTGGEETGSGPRLTTASQRKSKGTATAGIDRDVLHVRIDGRSYAMVLPEGDRPVSLEELLEQVQHFPGDRQGTRVRIARTPSSRTTAEIQLRDALVKAGLSEDEIDWQDGPRP